MTPLDEHKDLVTKSVFGEVIHDLKYQLVILKDHISALEKSDKETKDNVLDIRKDVNRILVSNEGMKKTIESMNEKFDTTIGKFDDHIETSTGFRDQVNALSVHRNVHYFLLTIIIAGILYFKYGN